MRLRPRPARTLGDDWVPARGSDRSTTIGNLDSFARAAVDPAGLVTLVGASWSLDWWIGAEDRWHLPCREVAVRQSLLSGSPVVETRLRVPSGDAVHRAYAARSAHGVEAVVVEIENASKVPFAVALAVRPHTGTGKGRVGTISIDGSVVEVDGAPAVVLGRSPGRVALSDAVGGDAADVVFAGDAAPVAPAGASCSEGLANGAFLFPLAHAATLRVVLPLASAGAAGPQAYPAAAQVASGWGTHAAAGTRIEVPDRRLRDAVAASTRHLLLGDRSPAVATALDLVGFPHEAGRLLTADPVGLSHAPDAGAALHALGRHWELTRDVEFAEAVVAVVAALYARARRAELGVVSLLDAAGERRAASDLRSAGVDPSWHPAGSGEGRDLADLLAAASSTWTWAAPGIGHDLAANASLVAEVRALLVAETSAGLSLSPVVPEPWLGQGWELHDAPTRHGWLSFAVRWHGDRPALLWDLAAHPGDVPITITAPGLDPSWSTQAPAGEALLAPVAVPERAPRRGLTIPVSIEPMPGRPS